MNFRFHEFLKLQNEIGNITRQEAVSMVGQVDLHLSMFPVGLSLADLFDISPFIDFIL